MSFKRKLARKNQPHVSRRPKGLGKNFLAHKDLATLEMFGSLQNLKNSGGLKHKAFRV